MEQILWDKVFTINSKYETLLTYAWLAYVNECVSADNAPFNVEPTIVIYLNKERLVSNVALFADDQRNLPSNSEIYGAFADSCKEDGRYLLVIKPNTPKHVGCGLDGCNRESIVSFCFGDQTTYVEGTFHASITFRPDTTFTSKVSDAVYTVCDYPAPYLDDFLSQVKSILDNHYEETLFNYLSKQHSAMNVTKTLQ